MRERFRIYDMGDVPGDRYTIVDTKPGAYGERAYFGCNEKPFHPQGIGMHGEFSARDWASFRGNYRRLGRRVALETLPADVQRAMRRFMTACAEGAA